MLEFLFESLKDVNPIKRRMSGRQDPRMRMPTPRGAYLQRGQERGAPPLRGARGTFYQQRGSPRPRALPQRAAWRGSAYQQGGARGAQRGRTPSPPGSSPPPPPSPPTEVVQWTRWEIATQLWETVKTGKWRQFWAGVPARRRCAVCVNVRAGSWAAAVVAAVGGVGGAALLGARAVRAPAWAAVYTDRAVLLAYLTVLAAVAALLLLPAAAVLVVGLALRSDALVEGYLWTVVAHLAADWLATGCMAAYCLVEPSCLRGRVADATCGARAGGGAFLVTGSVLMLGYSVVWMHLLIAVNSYRHTLTF